MLEILAPLASIFLSTFSLLMRASQGSVKRAGGDVAFAAASIQVGFLGVDLNSGNAVSVAWDFIMFVVFLMVWACIFLCLKVEAKCQQCSQYLEPSNIRAALSLVIGYTSILMAVALRLFILPLGG